MLAPCMPEAPDGDPTSALTDAPDVPGLLSPLRPEVLEMAQMYISVSYERPVTRPLPTGWQEPKCRIAIDQLPGLPSLPPGAAQNPFVHISHLVQSRPERANNE